MGMEMPVTAIRSQISSAIDIVVHLARLRDKSRKVVQIAEVGDAVVIGIVALAIGIRKAISVFIGAMMAVCVISGILLILKKLRRKDTIPFIPFILLSYMGVTLCG